jgi:hypothetical protein
MMLFSKAYAIISHDGRFEPYSTPRMKCHIPLPVRHYRDGYIESDGMVVVSDVARAGMFWLVPVDEFEFYQRQQVEFYKPST